MECCICMELKNVFYHCDECCKTLCIECKNTWKKECPFCRNPYPKDVPVIDTEVGLSSPDSQESILISSPNTVAALLHFQEETSICKRGLQFTLFALSVAYVVYLITPVTI